VHGERRSRGSLEQSILDVVARSKVAMTPGEVRDQLGADLAYTTVMTVMARLAEKHLLVRERLGRGYVYVAVTDEAEVTARQMQKLLDAQNDRAAVLARFVGTLQPGDEALLVDLLARADGPTEDAEQ
jgi:predicted transcriptional regulator